MAKFAFCRRKGYDQPVLNGLAYTPSQMYDMAKRGIPISTHMQPDDHFEEGDDKPDFDVPLEYRRGMDLNDFWNARQSIRYKMRDAHRASETARAAIGES